MDLELFEHPVPESEERSEGQEGGKNGRRPLRQAQCALQPVIDTAALNMSLGEVVPDDRLGQEGAEYTFGHVADGMAETSVGNRLVPPVRHRRIQLEKHVIEGDVDECPGMGGHQTDNDAPKVLDGPEFVLAPKIGLGRGFMRERLGHRFSSKHPLSPYAVRKVGRLNIPKRAIEYSWAALQAWPACARTSRRYAGRYVSSTAERRRPGLSRRRDFGRGWRR